MDMTFTEKQGATWRQRVGAVALIAAGIAGAWAWNRSCPQEHASEMQILTADNPQAIAETERLFADCRAAEAVAALADKVAEKMRAEERRSGVWSRIFNWQSVPSAAKLTRIFRENLYGAWLRERVFKITLAYKSVGMAEQDKMLSEFFQQMETAYRAQADKKAAAERDARDREVRLLNEKIASVQPPAGRSEQVKRTLGQLRSAVEKRTLPPVAWQRIGDGYPELATYTATLGKALEELRNACARTDQNVTRENDLRAWIAAPQNQTVKQTVKRVVHYEDTPEMIRLKDRKAAVEAMRSRLLLRATPLHPQAKKMAAEIEELNAQINALARLPQTVEDVEERTNPQLVFWKRELVDARTALHDARQDEQSARRRAEAALRAWADAEQAEMTLLVQKRRIALEKRRQELAAREFPPAPLPFAQYQAPTLPQAASPYRQWWAYAAGIALGSLLAWLWLGARREVAFQYGEPRTPEYPVLGVVPDFRRAEK